VHLITTVPTVNTTINRSDDDYHIIDNYDVQFPIISQ